MNIGFFQALLFIAAYHLPGGLAAVVGALQPLLVMGLAWLLDRSQFLAIGPKPLEEYRLNVTDRQLQVLKSALLAGLRLPTEGEITLDGRRIVGPSRHRGVVFQQSSSLYPWLSVRGNVDLALKLGKTLSDQLVAGDVVSSIEFACHSSDFFSEWQFVGIKRFKLRGFFLDRLDHGPCQINRAGAA